MSALWTGEALAAATGGALLPGGATAEVSGVAIDSRTLAPGALFVALLGDKGDGHEHVADAFARGAALAMVHGPAGPVAGPSLLVGDTLAGLAAVGRAGRARFSGRVVAVTGSVGKTTTKEMLRAALGAFGTVHAAEASHNNHWGVPLTLARCPAEASFCVAEIGTNHAGEIAPLASLVRPDVAIVTAVGVAHVGLIGGPEAVAREKASIFGALGAGGIAVLPDDGLYAPLLRGSVPAQARAVGFGTGAGSRARLVSVGFEEGRSRVTASIEGREVDFTLAALGAHMAMNAVAVLAACAGLGLDAARAASALASFRAGEGRGRARAILGGRATLLDESYNASTDSVRAALGVLALTPAERRIAVLGDMLEMGEWSEQEHRALAEPASQADLVFCCGRWSRSLYEALPADRRGAWAADAASLATSVERSVRAGDAVLVKGSNGSRMRLIVDRLVAADGNG